jgi:hypothetical protein
MPSVLLQPLSVPFCDDSAQVVSVRWSVGKPTVVGVTSKRSGRRCEVRFQEDVGVRILGELDLAGIWTSQPKELLQSTWLFVVRSRGWFDLEATRQDFYTKHEPPVTEYLIAGFQECVSVLARGEPTLVEMAGEPDA